MKTMALYLHLQKLNWKMPLNKCLIVLIGQALVVMACILFLLVYFPDIAVGTLDDQPELLRQASEQKYEQFESQRQILNERRKMAKGAVMDIGEGLSCSLFRFDQIPGNIEVNPRQMVNDEGEYAFFSEEDNYQPHGIPEWFCTKSDYCAGCLVIYGIGKYIASLKDVTIYPQFGHGKVGGEDIEDVIMQTEEVEEMYLDKGYFVVNSNENFQTDIQVSATLKKFVDGLIVLKETDTDSLHVYKRQDMVAVLVARRDYANFYHTTMELYDVFLIMVLFKIDPYHLEVIWLDAHPKSNLDNTWETLYGVPTRAGSLTEPIKYNKMVWSGFGYKSHINQHQTLYLPFAEEFRHFVLSRFEVDGDHVINCEQLRITIIWRRHHVAHPRNPSGYTARRIGNEKDVWKAVKEVDYRAVVNGVQLEKLNMFEQLELISRTDILIGMHGAGLTHILYLPKTSGVIELYPDYMSVANAHFRAMSKWRHLRHIVWANKDKSLERKDHQTIIPTGLIQQLVRLMIQNLCENY